MEQFSQEHSNLLLNKEWLAKSHSSKPYLFKFYSSTSDSICLIMVTDTKSVWYEVLNSNQIARRWRICNGLDPFEASSDEELDSEKRWRLSIIENLTKVHSPGGMDHIESFEVIASQYSDFAFEIEFSDYKWTWETCFTGPKTSAEIISKHLVLPLISLSHFSFSAANPVKDVSESDLEKEVDRVGRNARRCIDTHVKATFSKPRLTTSVRRMTAMLNFAESMPPISSENEIPQLQIIPPPRPTQAPARLSPPKNNHTVSPNLDEESENLMEVTSPKEPSSSPAPNEPRRQANAELQKIPADDSSSTESDNDEPGQDFRVSGMVLVAAATPMSSVSPRPSPRPSKAKSPAPSPTDSHPPRPAARKKMVKSSSDEESEAEVKRTATKPLSTSSKKASSSKAMSGSSSDVDSSPPRPAAKKKKIELSSSEDSEEERRKKVARLKSGGGRGRGGAKQPLRRGGHRF